jgi:hypothetical protein
MSAGLPGVGLSGVFFIVSALLMVPLEVARTLRGQSSLARWIKVLRQLTIALTMIACVELAYALLRLAVGRIQSAVGSAHVLHDAHAALVGGATHAGFGRGASGPPGAALHTLPVMPVLATLGVIALLLAVAKAAQLVTRWRAMMPACSDISSRRWLRMPPKASASAARSRGA